jgi:hypothetical protein
MQIQIVGSRAIEAHRLAELALGDLLSCRVQEVRVERAADYLATIELVQDEADREVDPFDAAWFHAAEEAIEALDDFPTPAHPLRVPLLLVGVGLVGVGIVVSVLVTAL